MGESLDAPDWGEPRRRLLPYEEYRRLRPVSAGELEGDLVGEWVGESVGEAVGEEDGSMKGASDGASEGDAVGGEVGECVGESVRTSDGELVGDAVLGITPHSGGFLHVCEMEPSRALLQIPGLVSLKSSVTHS